MRRIALALALVGVAAGARGESGSEAAEPSPSPPPRRTFDTTTTFNADALRALPRPDNAWAILRDVPGVVVDRVDVGGSETDQQSILVSHGDPGSGATWTLDGFDVTDPAALGFSSLYPDIDALASVAARTSAVDVRVRTPGVQVGLSLPEPGDRVSGSAHVRGAGEALQADDAASPTSFPRSRTEHLFETGAAAGGRVGSGRVWLFGSASLDELKQQTFTGHGETLRVLSLLGKGRMRLGSGTLGLLALHSRKTDDARDSTLDASDAARWRQSSPATLVAAESRHPVAGFSLTARLGWMDAGVFLEPRGGADADVYQDAHGIFQGSYYTLDSSRDRLQAGIELAGTKQAFGRGHDVVFGAGYRRATVDTRLAWPGGAVVAYEQQSVFFRAFELTGFAVPTRDQHGRTALDEIEVYASDAFRLGRFEATLGLRLDAIDGSNLASAVPANPVFPDLLPAVSYAGHDAEIRWLDLLPRIGLRFDAAAQLSLRATYAEYAAPLGSGSVSLDNPIGRESASLTYYWIDRNHDHAVEPGELDARYGLLQANGMDPSDPASAQSPHSVQADLGAPRTREGTLALEESFGRALGLSLQASLRRTRDVVWTPLSGLTQADYAATGGVSGNLFGEPYAVTFFAPATASQIVPGNGRTLANRDAYRQDALTLTLALAGQGARVRWNAWGAFSDWREYLEDRTVAVLDPTPLDTEPLADGGPLAVRPGGLGRGDVFVNARWSAGGSAALRLPGRLDLAGILRAREGFPIPYFEVGDTGDPTGGAKNVLVARQLDAYRLPTLVLLDARLAREFPIGRGRLVAMIDVFNLLGRSTALQVVRDVELPAFDRPREAVRPRIARIGLEYRF